MKKVFSMLTIPVLLTSGCGEHKKIEQIAQDEKIVSETTSLISINNRLFHIPNPIQAAMLMKKIAVPYNKEMLNKKENVENYTTNLKQALNIGVFGADIGYITANNQNQDALSHLSAIKKLSDELGVSSAFDFQTMEKFGNNVGNQQEMLSVVTQAYHSCENYLQKNERKDIAGLIMAGAWIEGLHFAISIAEVASSQEVIDRIGEQKRSLDNIILILNPFYSMSKAPEYSEFVDELVQLQNSFKDVSVEYTFEKTTCEEAKKICTIKSTNKVTISPLALNAIAKNIEKIRTKIIS